MAATMAAVPPTPIPAPTPVPTPIPVTDCYTYACAQLPHTTPTPTCLHCHAYACANCHTHACAYSHAHACADYSHARADTPVPTAYTQLGVSAMVKQARPAVVRITSTTGTGTGVIFDVQGRTGYCGDE